MNDAVRLSGWLRLALTPGIGGETQRKLLAAFGPPEGIFGADFASVVSVIGEKPARTLLATNQQPRIEAALAWAAVEGRRILTLGDSEYPSALLEIADPPTVIYVLGEISLLQRPAIAVVGSRNPTAQGVRNAELFAAALSESGLVVASGLALGIDAAAHRSTLAAGGETVAFIGTGIDRVYPSRNHDLAMEISRRGCIVSEFPLGTPAIAGNFPRRNRLISGFSLGVLVVEAAPESGSLITARLAAEQGRDVFAIPGSIHSPHSRGCHQLIKQGAKLVESVQDVLDELGPGGGASMSNSPGFAEGPAKPSELLDLLGFDPCSIDELVGRSGLPVEVLSGKLLELALEGLLSTLPGGRYQRISPH